MRDKTKLRNDWTKEEIEEIYNQPLLELIYKAASVHREWHNPEEVQMSTLLSIKTGGCPEDCSYCGQAARYHTDIKVQALLPTEQVIAHAQKAKDSGSSRFCMAAAWREVRGAHRSQRRPADSRQCSRREHQEDNGREYRDTEQGRSRILADFGLRIAE